MKSTLVLVGILAIFGGTHGQQCDEDEFECANGNCIAGNLECDGVNNCGDRSDEHDDCPPCPTGYWQCPSGQCILERWICDGDNDCGDWSDEPEDCPPCPSGYWQCLSGNCVYEGYICDGDNDCGDWSDETEEACPCSDDELRCSTPPGDGPPGACIPLEYVCDPDGIWDCADGSDEANCAVRSASKQKVDKVKVMSLGSKHAAHKKTLKAKNTRAKMMDSRKKFLKAIAKKGMKKQKHY